MHAEVVAREIERHAQAVARRAARSERALDALGEELRLVAVEEREQRSAVGPRTPEVANAHARVAARARLAPGK